jgi:hypothetical protein
MAIVLYVGGSKDGEKGVMPYGLSKLQAQGESGPEIYVERMMELSGVGRIRVMALEGLKDDLVVQRLHRHYR